MKINANRGEVAGWWPEGPGGPCIPVVILENDGRGVVIGFCQDGICRAASNVSVDQWPCEPWLGMIQDAFRRGLIPNVKGPLTVAGPWTVAAIDVCDCPSCQAFRSIIQDEQCSKTEGAKAIPMIDCQSEPVEPMDLAYLVETAIAYVSATRKGDADPGAFEVLADAVDAYLVADYRRIHGVEL